jgi:membrane fusion protein (multidrug efflux system)
VRVWLRVVTVCVLVAGALAYFKYHQIQAAIAFGKSFPEPVEAVEVFVARTETWQPTTTVTGEVLALRTVDLSNELPGAIVEVNFAPGAEVAAGQVLVRLDTREEQAQLEAAAAEAELARLDYSRNQRLMASGAAAEEARDRTRARFDAAQATVRRLQAIIDKKTLRAPFAARTGLHQLEPGQYLDKGTVVTRLIGTGTELWIDFTLPQNQLQLELGDPVQVRQTDGGPSQQATIVARDAFVTETSRNVRFRALCDNARLGLVPGSLVTVEVPLGAPRTGTVVPITAVRRDAFGARVFVLHPAEEGARAPDRAEQRTVTPGPQRGELLVIAAGLRAGERVAANGAFKLREGVLVRGAEPAEPSAGVPPAGAR